MNNPPWSDANSDHIDIGSDLAVPSSPVLSRLRAEPLLGYTALSSSSASRNVFSGSGYGKNIGSNGDSLSSWDPREDEEDEDGLALAGYGEEDGDDETDEETEEKNGGQDGEEAEEEQEHEEPGVLAYVDDETNETEKVDVGRAPPDDDKEESNYQEGRLTAEPVAEENETDTESTVRPSAGSLSLASLEELEPGTATTTIDPLGALALVAASDPPFPPSSPQQQQQPFKTPINYKANSSARNLALSAATARAANRQHTPVLPRISTAALLQHPHSAPARPSVTTPARASSFGSQASSNINNNNPASDDDALLEAAIAASSPVKALLQLAATPRYSDSRPSPGPRSLSLSSMDLPSPLADPPPLALAPRSTSAVTAVNQTPQQLHHHPYLPHPNLPLPTLPTSSARDDSKATYVTVIGSAILSHPNKRAPLSYILDWMHRNFPERFGSDRTGNWWGNSVRHNLSIQDCFVKVSPTGVPIEDLLTSPGNGLMSPTTGFPRSKGNCWTIRSDFLSCFREPEKQSASLLWHFERGRRHGSARTSRRRGRSRTDGKENAGGGQQQDDSELLSPRSGGLGSEGNLISPSWTDLASPTFNPAPPTSQQQQQKLLIRLPASSSQQFPAPKEQLRIGNPFASGPAKALLKPSSPAGSGKRKYDGKGQQGRQGVPILVKPVLVGAQAGSGGSVGKEGKEGEGADGQ